MGQHYIGNSLLRGHLRVESATFRVGFVSMQNNHIIAVWAFCFKVLINPIFKLKEPYYSNTIIDWDWVANPQHPLQCNTSLWRGTLKNTTL